MNNSETTQIPPEQSFNQKKPKGNKGLIILIIILIIVILGMAGYIAYDKGILSNNQKTSEAQKTEEEKPTNENTEEVEKPLNLSKCLNNSTATYTNPQETEGNYGLSMQINSDQKSINLSINWQIFGPLSGATAYASEIENYQITGFSKSIKSTFIGDLGQDAMGITLFYLMEDGTVEYTPMFIRKIDGQNNSYYETNYTYDYGTDGRITGQHFATAGMINQVTDIIKLYTADASAQVGWKTTIAAKKDGSFYDLGSIINK